MTAVVEDTQKVFCFLIVKTLKHLECVAILLPRHCVCLLFIILPSVFPSLETILVTTQGQLSNQRLCFSNFGFKTDMYLM